MPDNAIPTLYEWAGGVEALRKLTSAFYQKVPTIPLVVTLLSEMHAYHPERVACFLAEVLGGPADYSRKYGGQRRMVSQHLGRGLSEAHRKRWIGLLLETADEVNLPSDPEFRS